MIVFVSAFSAFNAVLALAALQRALRLSTRQGRAWWASKRLYAIALFTAWTLPMVCVAATAAGWLLLQGTAHWSAPAILAPVGWLIVMGAFFAIVDVSEDGVFDFGHGPRKRPDPEISPK